MYVVPNLPFLKVDIFFNTFLDQKFEITFFGPFYSDEQLV
jgi:hypothetical protein